MKSPRNLIFLLLAAVAGCAILFSTKRANESGTAAQEQSVPSGIARDLSALSQKSTSTSRATNITANLVADPTLPVLRLPELDNEILIEKAEKLDDTGRYRFATARKVLVNPSKDGRWTTIAPGRSRWEMDVHSVGARSINLGFSEFSLPPGAQLHVSSKTDAEEVYTFTADDNDAHGELWTPIVFGDTVSLRVDIDNPLAPEMELTLASVNHAFRGPMRKDGLADLEKVIGDASSGACNVDVNCNSAANGPVGPFVAMFADQIRSVGAYTVGGTETCSGALINNTGNDTRPFFLTADHCGVRQGNAASVVVYWNFQNSTCRTPNSGASGGNGNGPTNQFNSGSFFRSRNGAVTDFCLLELDDPVNPIFQPFFAGWNRATGNYGSATGIHHPSVSEKRICFEFDSTTTTSYGASSVPGDGNFIRISDWDFGTTEGGSSGSPLFDSQGLIVGQLFGGGAACGNNLSDWYGRINRSWTGGGSNATRLSNWLDPTGISPTTLPGIDSDQILRVSSALTVRNEGEVDFTVPIRVTLTPATNDVVTVRFRTVGGQPDPATPGSDFIPIDTLLTFTPGQTFQNIDVTIIGDSVPEENEYIDLILSDANNAIISSGGPSQLVILNDEFETPDINSDLVVTGVAQSSLSYRIRASGTPQSYSISGGPAGMTVNATTGRISWTAGAVGTYTVNITASNIEGSDTETLTINIEGNDLANGLDLTGGLAIDSGVIPWFLQSDVTHDGIDAGQSGRLSRSEETTFTLSVTGPDALRFFWKVSSETGSDFLSVDVGGIEANAISGEVDWTEVIVEVPELLDEENQPIAQDVTFRYAKDDAATDGDDTGWVDELELYSTTGVPYITSERELSISVGEPFTYDVVSIDPAATVNATGLPAGLTFSNGTISGSPTNSGEFDIALSANNGQSSTGTLVLTIVDSVGPAVEQPGLAWEPSGEQFWFPQSITSTEGGSAARSGPISDSESSTLSVDVTGPDWLSFWWKVSSENGADTLRFEFDQEVIQEISGEVEWTRMAMRIPPGSHTLEWIYEKDESGDDGLDSGFLDFVTIASINRQPFITSPNATVAFDGEPFGYQITAVNSPETYSADNLPAGLSLDANSGLISGTPAFAGTQTFNVTATNSLGSGSMPLTIDQATLDGNLPGWVDLPLLPITQGSPVWRRSSTRARGRESAASPAMFPNQSSEVSAYVIGPGSVSFQWKVSSEEDADFLTFFFDGIEQQSISGEVDWTTVELEIGSGQHEFTWVFSKDAFDDGDIGLDTGWIDDVQLSGYASFANEYQLRLGNAIAGADPDGDNYANLLEFIFLSAPDDTADYPVINAVTTQDQINLSFIATGEPGNVNIILQENTNLDGPWTDVSIMPTITEIDRFMDTYQYVIPISDTETAERKFFRIKATAPDQ